MRRILLRGGVVLNPQTHLHEPLDVLVEGEHIVALGNALSPMGAQVLEVSGCYVVPGLVDMHVHLRDPGFPDKETMATGTRAAAAGGLTTVVCMPNTRPTVDDVSILDGVLATARRDGVVRVHSTAALTKGLAGVERTDMANLAQHGAVAFTDDGKSVMDPVLLYDIFRTAAQLDTLIASHCEDHHLVRGGAMHRGKVSQLLQDEGIPALGEELVIARDLLFAADTGARLHIQHVSTARGVQLIREAKARGVRVTAEATPHHFSLTDAILLEQGALAKVNPPLRPAEDVAAVVAGLQDGTLDVIATDHAPHTLAEKQQGLSRAPFGFVGLETSVGLAFTHLVHTGKLSADQVVARMSVAPARVLGLPIPQIAVGEVADITVIDPEFIWTVDPNRFLSKAQHSPFTGAKLRGKAVATVVGGRVAYTEKEGLLT